MMEDNNWVPSSNIFILHMNSDLKTLMRKRNELHQAFRETSVLWQSNWIHRRDGVHRRDGITDAPMTSAELCSCCGLGDAIVEIMSESASDLLVSDFADLLNTTKNMGLAHKVDLFFHIGELAMVVDYEETTVGSMPIYCWDPSKKIRMCSNCYDNLKQKILLFADKYCVDFYPPEIKEPGDE